MKRAFIAILFYLFLSMDLTPAQTPAPGAPGGDAHWPTAAKQGIGTSAGLRSKVWFTLAQGAMTEVYYPNVTTANVQTLQFIVVDRKTKTVETEAADAIHTIRPTAPAGSAENTARIRPVSLTFTQVNIAKSGAWKLTKTYVTDPDSNTVLVDVSFEGIRKQLYVYFDPSIANTGMHDAAWKQSGALVSNEGDIFSALAIGTNVNARARFGGATNGFLGINDGLTDLRSRGTLGKFTKAENGNVVQVAEIPTDHRKFTLALSFGNSSEAAIAAAHRSLAKRFDHVRYEYEQGWARYVRTLPRVDGKYQAQFDIAAMVLKAQEDKTVRGANVASLTVPWGGGVNANEDVGGGYRLVWARDLYHVFTAYLQLGDKAAAARALDFLFNIQQKKDGSFPQNSWLDGKRGWGSLQMDEVAYPLIMAWQLSRFDRQTYDRHVKRAADFIVAHGPQTPQERWEEESGYSPSTIAAEVAGLICAADIARRNGDANSAERYLKTADNWNANIEKWTATTTGKYGDGNYYLRITQNAKPDSGDKIELNNGSGTVDERSVVDAGFLELVRLGLRPANDPLILKSIKVVDEQLRVKTRNGDTFYRYSFDGYGEQPDGRRWNFDGKYTGVGRPWPLLTGERGQFELAKCGTLAPKVGKTRTAAVAGLDAMMAFANDGLMIPEQVWDKPLTPDNIDLRYVPILRFGERTGSATPLAWSMAQFIRLALNIKAGKNLDTPQIVFDRYVEKPRTKP